MFKYHIIDEFDSYEFKDFLKYFNLSTSKINRIIHGKHYRINGEQKRFLKCNDELIIDDIFDEMEVDAIDEKLDIVFENQEILVVNKPRDLIIHGDGRCLDKIVANYLAKIGLKKVPRHINRIDKDTTGLVVYAKDPLTLAKLSSDLENHLIIKKYLAICHGKIDLNGVIDKPIGKDRHVNNKMVIYKHGLRAITKYERLAYDDSCSLCKITLITGRTHQIRLHFASINHPLVGDKIYGTLSDSEPLKLQAYEITLNDPVIKKDLTITVKSKLSLDGSIRNN